MEQQDFAMMQMKDGKPVVVVRRLITYDWVLYPSHKEAHIISEPKLIEKCATVYKESANENDYVPDFIMPLKDILNEVSNKDKNLNTVMESFDLGLEDLVGFNENHNSVIVRDNDNRIFVNISPDVKKRVDNFFAMF